MTKILNPVSVGEYILDMYEPKLGDVALSKKISESCLTLDQLNDIILGFVEVNKESAFQLSRIFGRSPESWLNLQQLYLDNIQ